MTDHIAVLEGLLADAGQPDLRMSTDEKDALRAAIALMRGQSLELCRAAPAGGDDLYRQACDSVEEWKARALEAEADIARIHAQINAENGPTFMGEPVVSAPAWGEPNGKLVGWWNGITPGFDGMGMPSIRWGADAEDSRHDIPLYDGYNPIHYVTPVSAPAVGRPYGGDPAEPRDDSDRYDSAPAGGDRPETMSPPEFDGSHVGIEDRPDMWPDWVHRVVENAINEFGVMRDNERQPQGTTSGGSPDYSRITPPVSANAVGEGPCQKCHGTLEVLTNHAEPWSASAYSPCPDCHPAAKKDSAPAGSGEVDALLNKWLVRYNELINMDRTHEAEQVLRCINDGKRALLRKLQQGADGWRPIETAPKDGTEFDVWCPTPDGGYRVANTWWCQTDRKFRTYGDNYCTWAHQPTHWREHPDAPASQGQEGGTNG